jgi:hypothetical protein
LTWKRGAYDMWLRGSFDDALTFQSCCFPDELIVAERMSELWAKRVPKAPASSLL